MKRYEKQFNENLFEGALTLGEFRKSLMKFPKNYVVEFISTIDKSIYLLTGEIIEQKLKENRVGLSLVAKSFGDGKMYDLTIKELLQRLKSDPDNSIIDGILEGKNKTDEYVDILPKMSTNKSFLQILVK